MTATETALYYAKTYGWYVFPIVPKTKKPYAGFEWREKSVNDPEKIQQAADSARYKNCNWALDCGRSNVYVVDADLDPAKKKDGYKDLEQLKWTVQQDAGIIVESPRAGSHYYFTGKGSNTGGTFAHGIDTRGEGGYVLIPGSITEDGNYTFIRKDIPQPIPHYITSHPVFTGATAAEKKENRQEPVGELDSKENISRAKAYLKKEAPDSVAGMNGNDTAYKVACRLRDEGLSAQMIAQLMLTEYNNQKCRPPWSTAEIERFARNAENYARDRAGNASPQAMFDPVPSVESTDTIRSAGDIRLNKLQPRDWISYGRYIVKNLTCTIAPGDAGKSSLAILEGIGIACNRNFTYNEIRKPGPVWYYNTEDPIEELELRIGAVAKYYNLQPEDLNDFYFSSGRSHPQIIARQDRRGLHINEAAINFFIDGLKKRNCRLLIIDPLVRSHRVEENDNGAMDMMAQQWQRVADEAIAAVSLLHHTNKGKGEHGNIERGRGAVSLGDACRVGHTFYTMQPDEAKSYGIPKEDCPWYVRLARAKGNLTPPENIPYWFKKQSVRMFFKSDETIGTLDRIRLDRVEQGESTLLIDQVFQHVRDEKPKSIYTITTRIKESGLIAGSHAWIRAEIERNFEESCSYGGYTIQPCMVYSGNDSSKQVKGLRAIKLLPTSAIQKDK